MLNAPLHPKDLPPVPQVGAKPKVGRYNIYGELFHCGGLHPRVIASLIRHTRTISLTSCTLTMSAPPVMDRATVAAVPSSR